MTGVGVTAVTGTCHGMQTVGEGRCPIVDTWWQTETGAAMIAPLPGAWPCVPGSATLPFFGVQPVLLDDKVHGPASFQAHYQRTPSQLAVDASSHLSRMRPHETARLSPRLA